jgi:hypothetical protein
MVHGEGFDRVGDEDQMTLSVESSNFKNHRMLSVQTGMSGYLFIFQSRKIHSVKEYMSFVHHTAEGMPAGLPLDPFSIEGCHVIHLMSTRPLSFLPNNVHLDLKGSFHDLQNEVLEKRRNKVLFRLSFWPSSLFHSR